MNLKLKVRYRGVFISSGKQHKHFSGKGHFPLSSTCASLKSSNKMYFLISNSLEHTKEAFCVAYAWVYFAKVHKRGLS